MQFDAVIAVRKLEKQDPPRPEHTEMLAQIGGGGASVFDYMARQYTAEMFIWKRQPDSCRLHDVESLSIRQPNAYQVDEFSIDFRARDLIESPCTRGDHFRAHPRSRNEQSLAGGLGRSGIEELQSRVGAAEAEMDLDVALRLGPAPCRQEILQLLRASFFERRIEFDVGRFHGSSTLQRPHAAHRSHSRIAQLALDCPIRLATENRG
jgi:hypothetical protein